MTKVIVNVMGVKVREFETEKEITLELILKGVSSFKKDMDKIGVSCKISKPNSTQR